MSVRITGKVWHIIAIGGTGLTRWLVNSADSVGHSAASRLATSVGITLFVDEITVALSRVCNFVVMMI